MEERNTLLIVDDFEFNRLMLSDTFSDRRVVEAENGKRAIEEFEKNKDKLCAVLLDIMMPVMDGFGVLEYLVDNRRYTGVHHQRGHLRQIAVPGV